MFEMSSFRNRMILLTVLVVGSILGVLYLLPVGQDLEDTDDVVEVVVGDQPVALSASFKKILRDDLKLTGLVLIDKLGRFSVITIEGMYIDLCGPSEKGSTRSRTGSTRSRTCKLDTTLKGVAGALLGTCGECYPTATSGTPKSCHLTGTNAGYFKCHGRSHQECYSLCE